MGAEKKPAAGGRDKKDDGKSSAVSVFKVVTYCGGCDGCADKIKSVVKHMDGVEDAKVDTAGNILTVTLTGKVDAAKIKARLEKKAKEVHIVSQPKKDSGGGGAKKPRKDKLKKAGEKPKEQKVEGKKSPEDKPKKAGKKPEEETVKEKKPPKEKTKKKVNKARELIAVTRTMELMWLQDKLRGSKDVAPTNKQYNAINIYISGDVNFNIGK